MMEFIEVIEDWRCRCCLRGDIDEMENIFDCEAYNEVELQSILRIVTTISIAQDDGKYCINPKLL